MPVTVRRIAILTTVALTTALAACTNPVAPSARQLGDTPERPSTTAVQGSVG